MWNIGTATGLGVAMATTIGTLTVCRRLHLVGVSSATRVERCETIDDLVRCMQDLARRRPTDDLALHLATRFQDRGITEECLVRLSKLHRRHGGDNGLRGYAVTFVWSILARGIAEGDVVVVCSDPQ